MKQTLTLAIGTAVIIFMTYGALSLSADHLGKVWVCHKVSIGNKKGHVIEISENALKAHLAHGDSMQAAGGLKPGDPCQPGVLK